MEFLGFNELIKKALEEDLAHGDITTTSLIPEDLAARGIFLARASGVLAGLEVSRAVFTYLEPSIEFTSLKKDGEEIVAGETLAQVQGRARTLLCGERVALNFLQRLSGIATHTRRMVELVKDSNVRLLDTRKTTPGWRVLEKYAVQVGGAHNHRFGLYDGVMIKDNHLKMLGSISQAVALAREKVPPTLKIEVEVENLDELKEALLSGADLIMLDNMDPGIMKEAVRIAAGSTPLEASGGINESNLREVAATGVDFISLGALTHSSSSLDISFNLEKIIF